MMASLWSCLKKFGSFLCLFLTPLVLLPLMIQTQFKPAACAYVILLMAVYWCTEVIPLAVTSLLPALLFPFLKILDSKEVCHQYMKDTTMLFLGGLVVAVAVEHWNLHKRIALRTLLIVGVSPGLLMLGFMGITAFLSMWISNTATTAMMVPIVQAVLGQLKLTDEEDVSHPPSIELLDKGEQEVQGENVLQVKSRETIAKKKNTCKALILSVCYAASIGGTATLTGTGPNMVLSGQMSTLFPENKDVINFTSWLSFAFPNMILMLFISWIWLQFVFLGVNLKRNLGIGMERTSEEKAFYLLLKEEYQKLGPPSYAEINVFISFLFLVLLWLFRDPGFMPGWQAIYWEKDNKSYVSDGTVAILISILLFIIPSQKFKFNFRSQTEEEWKVPFYPPPLLTWKVVQEKLPWGVMLLLGGGFALAKGCEASGLSRWLGSQMEPLKILSPIWLVLLLSTLIALFTEYMSNIATATLFLPIFATMAQNIQLNPLFVMLPCTLSCSFAFMLPVATPPNAIVFSYGHLKVSDMVIHPFYLVKAGFVMNIIALTCVFLAINTWGRLLFDLENFPSWANITQSSSEN